MWQFITASDRKQSCKHIFHYIIVRLPLRWVTSKSYSAKFEHQYIHLDCFSDSFETIPDRFEEQKRPYCYWILGNDVVVNPQCIRDRVILWVCVSADSKYTRYSGSAESVETPSVQTHNTCALEYLVILVRPYSIFLEIIQRVLLISSDYYWGGSDGARRLGTNILNEYIFWSQILQILLIYEKEHNLFYDILIQCISLF